jgi:opacity protein-like surface antigen
MKRLLTLITVLSAGPAYTQGFELAALAGYTTPGNLKEDARTIESLKLAGSFTWGASASFFFSPQLGVEVCWARQDSAVELSTPQARADLFDVTIDQLQGSFVYQLGGTESRFRPFLSAGAGAAFFSATDIAGETKLSFSIGAGLKWLPTKRVGARLQARYTPTWLHDAGSDFCDPFGFCQDWLHQFELTGGLVVRF